MPTTTAVELPSLERSSAHDARCFTELPGTDSAIGLLTELADAPCAFAPVPMDRPLALYGAGSLGRLAREFLTSVDRDFALVVDRDAGARDAEPYWSGVPIHHPDDVPAAAKRDCRLAVSIVTSPYVPIERSLLDRGFDDVVPFYDVAESFRALHPLSNGWFAPPLTASDRDNTAQVLAGWHDDISRAHHLQFLAWRGLRAEWAFDAAPVRTDNRYFIPEVAGTLRDDEMFVDAGAHHGSVTRSFLRQTKNAVAGIATIEPDPANRAILDGNLESWLPGDARIMRYDCALAATEGPARFRDGLGYASQLTALGERQVMTRPLDALGLAPTFLKLHLEGGELSALKGGQQTLLSSRPIIAATVYHNADGIWQTPLWLMENLTDYRFLFRSHGWCGTGAVVYAIPEERYG